MVTNYPRFLGDIHHAYFLMASLQDQTLRRGLSSAGFSGVILYPAQTESDII